MIKTIFPMPAQWFGPVSQSEARDIVESMFVDSSLQKTLEQFLTNEMDAREFIYTIQVIAENIQSRPHNGGADDDRDSA